MQSHRPTFRPDLIAKPVTVAGKRLFEVRDPGTGRTLRFTEDGYSIAYLLNGKRTHSDVVEEFAKQRGIHMSLGKLGQLIDQLELLGCLVCDPNLTVPYHALATVAIPVLGDGGLDEAMATVVLGAEAFKDYYTIVPDAMATPSDATPSDATRPGKKSRAVGKAKATIASCGSAALARPRAKPKRVSAPPPIPALARGRQRPRPAPVVAAPAYPAPPVRAWPAIDYAMGPSSAPLQVQARAVAPSSFSVPKPHRFPRARAHAEVRRAGLASAQSLWLAGGFFAASLLWASWALFRLGV